MKTQKQIVKELISLQLECLRKMDQFESVGITINLFGNYELLNKALDLIGFPEDNTVEFDLSALNGQQTISGKRTDFDNIFCRDYLYDNSFFDGDTYQFKTVDEYVDWLYQEVRRIHTEGASIINSKHFSGVSLN
ncbi:hypothetical protein [Parabacteroides pacaensis]|uniref:hypothetical protein n=1 Tax=Parabacteroides pacaensis TaxID=2086575 RepID=UPI000D1094CC|nr:hypothetical protein [Parabacteroides pacaensis]